MLLALSVYFQEVVGLLLFERLFRMTMNHIHTDRLWVDPDLFDKFEAVLKTSDRVSNHNWLIFGE